MNPIVIGLVALLVGAAIGWVVSYLKAQADAKSAGHFVAQARQQAETIVRDATVRAQDQLLKALEEFGPTPLHRLSFEPVRARSLFPLDYNPQMDLFAMAGAA